MAIRKNPFKPYLNKIPTPFRNWYFWVLVLFFAWLILFDRHDFLTNWKLQQTLNKLEEDKRYYQDNIEDIKKDKEDIEKDKEKFAREHYYMQKDNEDVFIIEKEEE